jgi:hypothetical protein
VFTVFDHEVGNGLGVRLVDRLSHPDSRIKPVINLDRADPNAVSTAITAFFIDIAGILSDGHPKMPYLT